MAKRILPIRLEEEAILRADSLVPFVKDKDNPHATRSDVIRLCLDYGLEAMDEAANPTRRRGVFGS